MGQLEKDPAGQEPAGQAQLDRDRHSWTGTSYSHETGTRPTGFSYAYKYLLVPSRLDSNKQCFHNQYMHTCLLRATSWSWDSGPRKNLQVPGAEMASVGPVYI